MDQTSITSPAPAITEKTTRIARRRRVRPESVRTGPAYGSASLLGGRRTMEDAVTVAPAFFGEGSTAYDFFGVYDGHGGARAAEMCRDGLHVVVAEEMSAPEFPVPEFREGRWSSAMEASFARVDVEVTSSSEKTVGTTAVVSVVGPSSIVVANCGDSRAVLCRGGVAVVLSSDHKPQRPDELERIEAAGGRVINWRGHRVLGVLATSRSIGDYYLKPYVISKPEVTVTDRSRKDEFLILASDGLWDVVSNEEACLVVRQCLNGRMARLFPESVTGSNASDAAAVLAQVAICRGSNDNVSVVVVDLKQS